MSYSQIEVIDAQTEDNLTGIIIDGTPHLYWLRIYKSLGLTAAHAGTVIKKLIPGTHYVKFTKQELNEKYPTINTALIVDIHASAAYFLTKEGANRAIMEIRTSEMDNEDIAKAIDKKKDTMAAIFTRYEAGETLSKAADESVALSGEILLDTIQDPEKKIRLYNTARKIAISLGADRSSTNKVMIEMIKEECPEVYPFMAMIPQGNMDNAPDDAIMTRKEVSAILKVSLQDLEERIVKIGWVMRTVYGWLPTPKGSKYLKPDPHAGEKRTWYDIRFGLDAIAVLKQEFEQRVLTGGFLSSGQSRSFLPGMVTKGTRRVKFSSRGA